ncbi:acyl-CoA dehydrogenase family protein [Frankia sp. Mgl5]|uniref:acyl-CoA dehydrogenase family protein n=1 Tax=Frankia sp. Mgl5 TaxID=2933793 RepID=UPI002010AEE8|nr:acyl-CoA dehydrogenase family protein [Frankia sp. Mgl5]MCK9926453.1 acyl-CoA dehydrogenase family protein [Frankia sp. Mgl5]
MQFRLDEDQLAMRGAVRAFCADRFGFTGIADRAGKPLAPGLWPALAELGVLGVLGDADGGGIGVVAAALAFEQFGEHLAGGPVLWSTLAAPFVPGAADGRVRVAGVELADGTSGTGGTGGTGGPLVVEHADECDVLLLLRDDRLEVCPRADLPPPLDGAPLDPLTPVTVFPHVPAGQVVGGAADARRLRRAGEILSAAQLVGVAQGALDTARDHALERVQFGVPIGSFQAVKHLLADMYVRVELARSATYAAAATAADPRAGDPDRAASTAKLLAGEAGIANGRAAVQILGGMGFTWDMLPHYFLKRAWVLENGFGTTSWHAARLGAAVGDEAATP